MGIAFGAVCGFCVHLLVAAEVFVCSSADTSQE